MCINYNWIAFENHQANYEWHLKIQNVLGRWYIVKKQVSLERFLLSKLKIFTL